MTIKTIEDSIQELALLVGDFKNGIVTPKRIKRWIAQFPGSSQGTILHELIHILNSYYVSKDAAKENIASLFDFKEVMGESFLHNKNNISFLNIQLSGTSQIDLLDLVDNHIGEFYNLTLQDCGSTPSKYIYIDECFYSGNRVYRDIEAWIGKAVPNTELHLVFWGLHTRNFKYIREKLIEILKQKNISLFFWRIKEIYDTRISGTTMDGKYECLWAPEGIYEEQTQNYINDIIETRTDSQNYYYPLLRQKKDPVTETLFSNQQNREIVEKAFLEKGAYIKTYGKQRNENMRAMGYDNNKTLGFGSMFITYRNIANNCPIVLWWGNDEETNGLGDWYPLFPRTVNL